MAVEALSDSIEIDWSSIERLRLSRKVSTSVPGSSLASNVAVATSGDTLVLCLARTTVGVRVSRTMALILAILPIRGATSGLSSG